MRTILGLLVLGVGSVIYAQVTGDLTWAWLPVVVFAVVGYVNAWRERESKEERRDDDDE